MTTEKKRATALLEARRLGHHPTPWMPDVCEWEYLSQCMTCDRFMAAGPDEPRPWGWLVTHECSGRAMA